MAGSFVEHSQRISFPFFLKVIPVCNWACMVGDFYKFLLYLFNYTLSLMKIRNTYLFLCSPRSQCFVWLFVCAQTCLTLFDPMDCRIPMASDQAPLSMGFSRLEYKVGCRSLLQWSSYPGVELASLESSELAGKFFTTSPTSSQRDTL